MRRIGAKPRAKPRGTGAFSGADFHLHLRGTGPRVDVGHRALGRIDDAHRPCDAAVRDEIVVNFFALLGQQLLGIVQLPVPEFLRKNNRGRYHRPRERAAPRFVDAGDSGNTERAQFAFMPKTTAPVHGGKILKS